MDYKELRFKALKVKTYQELLDNKELYNECVNSGDFENLTKHLHGKKRILTNDDLMFIASFYDDYTVFRKEAKDIYGVCLDRKILNVVCSHMRKRVHLNTDKNTVLKLALKYNSRMEFKNNKEDGWAYNYAVKHKFLNEACSHMESVGNKYYRCIYVYEIPEYKVCYVGLTYSLHKRHLQHKNPKFYSAVNEFCKSKNIELPLPIQKTEYVSKDEAALMEKEYIEKYKIDGWTILNKQKAGNLGGSKNNITYTKEMCIELAKKYKTRYDFSKDYQTAYKYIKLYGWDTEVFAHIDGEVKRRKCEKLRLSNSKKVIQYDLDGNVIGKFQSVTEANEKTGICLSSILSMCHNKVSFRFIKNCVFKFESDNFDDDLKERIKKNKEESYKKRNNPKEHKVGKLDNNGNIIEIFKNCRIAGESINRAGRTVFSACVNPNRTAGGFHWKFLN